MLYEYTTIESRYRTTWPALAAILGYRWTRDTIRSLTFGSKGWVRALTGTLLGGIPGLLVANLMLAVLLTGAVYWPFGVLQMLPVRVAVRRGSGEYGPVWMLSFFSGFTLGILWVIALTMAMKDTPEQKAARQAKVRAELSKIQTGA